MKWESFKIERLPSPSLATTNSTGKTIGPVKMSHTEKHFRERVHLTLAHRFLIPYNALGISRMWGTPRLMRQCPCSDGEPPLSGEQRLIEITQIQHKLFGDRGIRVVQQQKGLGSWKDRMSVTITTASVDQELTLQRHCPHIFWQPVPEELSLRPSRVCTIMSVYRGVKFGEVKEPALDNREFEYRLTGSWENSDVEWAGDKSNTQCLRHRG